MPIPEGCPSQAIPLRWNLASSSQLAPKSEIRCLSDWFHHLTPKNLHTGVKQASSQECDNPHFLVRFPNTTLPGSFSYLVVVDLSLEAPFSVCYDEVDFVLFPLVCLQHLVQHFVCCHKSWCMIILCVLLLHLTMISWRVGVVPHFVLYIHSEQHRVP